ncbi:MAG: LlaJI family restriction endonuclease [Fibrobacter sp.]|nr:LlaJI family restriction endonuclease [Fibrobacter sp.]
MTALAQHIAESAQKTIPSFADFCVYDAWKSGEEKKDKSFVGIKIEDNQPRIYFPMGYRSAKPSEDICKQDFYRLIAVLSDKSLQSYFTEEDLEKSQLDFPFYAYLSVLQYYLDFGYYVESETIYKKGFSGKISWPRTIRRIKPQVVKDEEGRHQVVYLNLITRKTSYREDNLITLVHKYCVKEAARLIGPLYGISEDEVDDSELLFEYELFAEVIQDKIAATFKDKHLELFRAMLKMVRYLGDKENHGEDGKEPEAFFGVDKFAPLWEGMVDKIFGKLPQGVTKDKFNPHCEWDLSSGVRGYENPNYAMRPDTIMWDGDDKHLYVLDAKYYKFGMTGSATDLPSSGSICKQIAYAEYVETHWKEILGLDSSTSPDGSAQNDAPPKPIYNAFVLPYCFDADNSKLPPDDGFEKRPCKMRFIGHCHGDWKNIKAKPGEVDSRPYHRIAGILLDVKSVMQNYSVSGEVQKTLAELVEKK